MSLIITESAYDVTKAITTADGNREAFVDVTAGVEQMPVRPRLISTLMAPSREFLMGRVAEMRINETVDSLPDGKSYSEYAGRLGKDNIDKRYYEVPSFGISFNVRPEDAVGQLKLDGSMQPMMPEDIQAEMLAKAPISFDSLEEVGLAQLITTDTNIVRGGPFTSYNFYTDIVGSSRPTPASMDFATTTTNHEQLARIQAQTLRQEMAKAGLSYNGIVVLCSDNFFDAKYEIEKLTGLARELTWGVDLASNPQPTMNVAGWDYPTFKSRDGLTYINYGSEIISGTKLIPENNAYMVPVASGLLTAFYAPKVGLSSVNRRALRLYAENNVSERQGYTTHMESNVLYANKQPRAIRHLTV